MQLWPSACLACQPCVQQLSRQLWQHDNNMDMRQKVKSMCMCMCVCMCILEALFYMPISGRHSMRPNMHMHMHSQRERGIAA